MTTTSIIEKIVGVEGGYANDANDLGGETMWGITKAVARENGYMGVMSLMPRQMAVAIYRKRYVNEPGFNRIVEVSDPIAAKLVDICVNIGPALPGVWLQRGLNALNQQAKIYPDLVVDGKVGPATVSALRALLMKRGPDGEIVMLRILNCLQGARYLEITEAREKNETFFYGWMLNRVEIE